MAKKTFKGSIKKAKRASIPGSNLPGTENQPSELKSYFNQKRKTIKKGLGGKNLLSGRTLRTTSLI